MLLGTKYIHEGTPFILRIKLKQLHQLLDKSPSPCQFYKPSPFVLTWLTEDYLNSKTKQAHKTNKQTTPPPTRKRQWLFCVSDET